MKKLLVITLASLGATTALAQSTTVSPPGRDPATRSEPGRAPATGEAVLPPREALVDGGSWSLDTRVEQAYVALDTTRTKGTLTREALAEAGGEARRVSATSDEPEAQDEHFNIHPHRSEAV